MSSQLTKFYLTPNWPVINTFLVRSLSFTTVTVLCSPFPLSTHHSSPSLFPSPPLLSSHPLSPGRCPQKLLLTPGRLGCGRERPHQQAIGAVPKEAGKSQAQCWISVGVRSDCVWVTPQLSVERHGVTTRYSLIHSADCSMQRWMFFFYIWFMGWMSQTEL